MNPFTWQDRDSAAHHLMQLVYHGPASIRHSALETLQAIRSLSVVPELKQIAFDTNWSNKDRSDAVYALAAMPGDMYLPEMGLILAGYAESGFARFWQALEDANKETLLEHSWGERDLVQAVFKFIGLHPSNRTWFLTLLAPAQATVKVEFLERAIEANCCYPGEPFFLDLLTKHLDQFPELMTLETLNTVANHGGDAGSQWLVAHVESIISLCVDADENSISAVLSFSRSLTAKVAETHLEIAKLSSVFPYLETSLKANTPDSGGSEAPRSCVSGFYASAIWQRLERIYQQANGGDKLAFEQLYDLTSDSRLSVPVRAVATYFFGKLWTHNRALSKLCRLAREGDEMWARTGYANDRPIRIEAMNALQATGTPQAWETLVDVIFLDRASVFGYHERYLRWLSALTSQLDPSIPFEPVKEDQYNTHIENRPWFDALAEATDDIDTILKDL